MLHFFKKKTILVDVTIYVESDNGVFYASSPALPGFHVEGKTEDELLAIAKDAMVAYLKSLIKHNEPLPISRVLTEVPKNAHTRSFTQRIPAYA